MPRIVDTTVEDNLQRQKEQPTIKERKYALMLLIYWGLYDSASITLSKCERRVYVSVLNKLLVTEFILHVYFLLMSVSPVFRH